LHIAILIEKIFFIWLVVKQITTAFCILRTLHLCSPINIQTKQDKETIMKNALSITVTLFSLIASAAVMADDTTSTKVDLDKRGDRIEHRLDNKGDRIEERLDNRGDRIEHNLDAKADKARDNGHEKRANHLERKGDRIDQHLDNRGDRIDNHYDRKGERINNRLDHRAKRK
jgi:hypothetical protein